MKKSISLILLWWCLFFSVLGWKPDFAYNAQRYFEWLLLGTLLVLGMAQPVRVVLSRNLMLLYLLFVALAACVVLSAPGSWLAIRYALTYIALFAVASVIAKSRFLATPEVFDRAALLGVVCLCFGASLIALEGLLVSLSIGEVSHLVIFAAFVNVRMMADMQFVTLFLLPAAWLLLDSSKMRVWVSVTAALWWGWLFFSGTRATLVVIPWTLLVVWVCAGRTCLPWGKRLLLQLLSGIGLFVAVRVLLRVTGFVSDDVMELVRPGAGTSGRFDHWIEAWQHFLQHPWLGSGPGGYACFTQQFEATPHNIFFMLLSEWGGLVTLLVSVIALRVFFVMTKHLRTGENSSPMALSLFASVVAIVTAAQLQGVFIAPIGQMLVVLVFGWAWHVFSSHSFSAIAVEQGRWRGLQWLLVAVLLGGWLVMARADIALQKTLLVLPNGAINLSYAPRYWAEGHDHCPIWQQRHLRGLGFDQ